MVGSQNINKKNVPRYQSNGKGSAKQKKLDALNLKIELVEQQRIGLAKKIALAELERDRLKLEARRIVAIDALKDVPGEVTSITDAATAKVNAFLEESRKAAAAAEVEKCKLRDEANKCVVEDDEIESDNYLANPTIMFGSFMFAAAGARMALQNRDEKQLEMKQEVIVDANADAIDEVSVERKIEKGWLISDSEIAKVDNLNSNHNLEIIEEELVLEKGSNENGDILRQNKTEDLDFLVDDLQDAFDEAIQEAAQTKKQKLLVDSSVAFSFSWEGNDTIPEISVINDERSENESSEQSLDIILKVETPNDEETVAHVKNADNVTEAPITEIPRKDESRVEQT